jgi:predicted ArsR family transcriptional regulator
MGIGKPHIKRRSKMAKLDQKWNAEELLKVHSTKSAVIRYLASQGVSRGDIARILGIRYQHVRNVLTQPLKREG